MKYHIFLRLAHWMMAVCILGLIALGWYMTGLTPEQGKYDYYFWHKSFGVLVILLFPVRALLRHMTDIPPLPEGIKPLEQTLSRAVQVSLYVLMIFVPLIGYVMSTAGGHAVPFFGLIVPDLIGENKMLGGIAHEAHWISAYALLGLVVLHVAGALKHRFFEPPENDVIRRMI